MSAFTFQFKRASNARWLELNPVLLSGEPGVNLTTLELKIGDGITPWTSLPSVSVLNTENISQAVAAYLEAHPIVGATTEYVDEVVAEHEQATTPHKAYDYDMQSLSTLFENGLL